MLLISAPTHTQNIDNGVLVAGCDRITVQGFDISVTADRRGGPEMGEGHWGARVGASTDIRISDFSIK